jgi:hypothetical protein
VATRLLAHLYVLAHTCWESCARVARVLHQGFWLGLLEPGSYRHLSTLQYARWPKYRSDTHNLSGFFPWEERLVSKEFPPGGSVLVPAAGGGREVIALARAGFRPTSFECQPLLVALAQDLVAREGLQASVLQAEPDAVPAGLPRFDAILVGWGSLIHIPGRGARVAFLRALRACVEADAPLAASFFLREEGSRRHRWVLRLARLVRALRMSRATVEPGDVLDGTFDHYFTEREVREEFTEAGWEVLLVQAEPFPHLVARARALEPTTPEP